MSSIRTLTTHNMHVVSLIKDNGELYQFHFTKETAPETLRTFGSFASNPDLSFSWYDAAVLCGKVRGMANQECEGV